MLDVRKTVVSVEETWHEGGPRASRPLLIGSAIGVVRNPFAGRYVEDLLPFGSELRQLGLDLAQRIVHALGGDATSVQAYGKGAVVGSMGELEHGALWHEAGGYAMRHVLGGTKAIVPATKVVGAVGTRLVVPLGHINASYVRSHFLTVEVGVQDAPRPDEVVYALAMATGGRIHARVGGLTVSEIKVHDGQR